VAAAATPIDVAERSTVSSTDSNLPPRPAEGPVVPHDVPVLQQKGKRVTPGTDEGPESKKLRAQRDSGFMVGQILALAKVYAPPSSQNPPTAMSFPRGTAPVAPPVDPVACLGAEPNSGDEVVVGGGVPSSGSPAPSLPGGEPDTFSQEFNKLQE
jgi:hypothetical protein